MASVLIVEDDWLVARHLARTVRDVGHTPTIAPDARSALLEVADRPDLVLLDLGLPDLPGEELLPRLRGRPGTAQTPVLVITGKKEAGARLKASRNQGVTGVLLKPVSAAQLRQAVDAALSDQPESDPRTLRRNQERQAQLIKHLIVEGSDALVFHTCRRMSLDRTQGRGSLADQALTWTEIANWATREGLVNAEQASLLRQVPMTKAQALRQHSA